MLQVNRTNNLKVPKTLTDSGEFVVSKEDKFAIKQAILNAKNKKIDKEKELKKIEEDKELNRVNQIPFNANELMVITIVKKLGAYVITVTQKSPAKFRSVFVNRMQNLCLDVVECLLQANFIRLDSLENKKKREVFQKEAVVKLKMLGYISMMAETSGCILKKQYKQISMQIGEAINLIAAWKKSDDTRWKNKN